MGDYAAEVRDKGEITIPKQLRDQYNLKRRSVITLIPRPEGILLKPRNEDPVGALRGLARGAWPPTASSVEVIRNIRRSIEEEAGDPE